MSERVDRWVVWAVGVIAILGVIALHQFPASQDTLRRGLDFTPGKARVEAYWVLLVVAGDVTLLSVWSARVLRPSRGPVKMWWASWALVMALGLFCWLYIAMIVAGVLSAVQHSVGL